MNEYGRNQIMQCMEEIEKEIAKEKEMDIEEVQNKLKSISEVQKILLKINEDSDVAKWCKRWWKDYYPEGDWRDAFRIYIFEQFLDCEKSKDIYVNVKISLSQEDVAEKLASKLREMNKIDVRREENEHCYIVTGMFGILEEKKVKKLIEEFRKEYPTTVTCVQSWHSKEI